jgi:prolyl-tRNA synthetase
MELGHIFKLRYAISEPLHATFTDEEGNERTIIMGCYGIGVSRIISAVAEVCNDANGLIWPAALAPFQVQLICANMADVLQHELAEQVYQALEAAGLDVLYDDREERAGSKFKDADLIGAPLQIVVGKLAAEGKAEVRDRATKASEAVAAGELAEYILQRCRID